MINNACRGCKLFKKCDIKFYLNDIELHCPCSVCLVKGICNRDCKDFQLFKKKASIKKIEYNLQRVDELA